MAKRTGQESRRRRRRIPTIASDVPDAVSQAEEAGDDEERQHGVRVGLPKPHKQEQAHVKGGGCTKQEKRASPWERPGLPAGNGGLEVARLRPLHEGIARTLQRGDALGHGPWVAHTLHSQEEIDDVH